MKKVIISLTVIVIGIVIYGITLLNQTLVLKEIKWNDKTINFNQEGFASLYVDPEELVTVEDYWHTTNVFEEIELVFNKPVDTCVILDSKLTKHEDTIEKHTTQELPYDKSLNKIDVTLEFNTSYALSGNIEENYHGYRGLEIKVGNQTYYAVFYYSAEGARVRL